MKKKCPDCEKMLDLHQLVCECGYDYMMDDCPSCDRRVPEGTMTCPYCCYEIVSIGNPKKLKSKAQPTSPEPNKSTIKVIRLSKIFVPAAATIAQWPEWAFKKPTTDENMLEWAKKLRTAAEKVGDNLTNHALGYLAQMHDNKELQLKWMKLIDLLGGDDYK